MNLNKVLLAGRITADPVLKSTQGGQNVCAFSLATNRVWQDANGNKKEQVEFHNVVAWGRSAETIAKFATKGSLLLVEGRLATREWKTKDNSTRKTTEIIVERFQFGPRTERSEEKPTEQATSPEVEQDTNDLPF